MSYPQVIRYNGPFQSTWLVGEIDCSYVDLVNAFGDSNVDVTEYFDGKVDIEWRLMTEAGIATIYNYKDGPNYMGAEGTPVHKIRDWHIGGTDPKVVGYIYRAMMVGNK